MRSVRDLRLVYENVSLPVASTGLFSAEVPTSLNLVVDTNRQNNSKTGTLDDCRASFSVAHHLLLFFHNSEF
jgi:hypothetical protein